jgi:hypothetical protein
MQESSSHLRHCFWCFALVRPLHDVSRQMHRELSLVVAHPQLAWGSGMLTATVAVTIVLALVMLGLGIGRCMLAYTADRTGGGAGAVRRSSGDCAAPLFGGGERLAHSSPGAA